MGYRGRFSTPPRSSSSSRSACSPTTAGSRCAGYARDALPFLGCWFAAALVFRLYATRRRPRLAATWAVGVPVGCARARARPRARRSSGKEAAFLVVVARDDRACSSLGRSGCLPRGRSARAMTPSIRPYSTASSGVMKRSRSMSAITCSTGRPVWRGDDLRHLPGQLEDLARGDLDVGRRAAEAAGALVDHDLRVRQREALAGGAAAEDHRGRRHAHAEADGRDVGLHVLHRVVDRHPRVGRAAGRVDVEPDVLVGILGLEEEELRGDQVRDGSSTSWPRKTIRSRSSRE